MRCFVIGTGRCGTMTFAEACKSIDGFTVGHETRTAQIPRFDYPDNHIEIDGHLQWVLPQLLTEYPDAIYVHLIRDKKECVESLAQREQSMKAYAHLLGIPHGDREAVASTLYDNQNELIARLLPRNALTIRIEDIEARLPALIQRLDATYQSGEASRAARKRYNATVPPVPEVGTDSEDDEAE